MFQPQLDALIVFASSERFRDELLKAKAEYFAGTGEVFEDDRSFEMRMASFLDYYLLDRNIPGVERTPAQLFLQELDNQVDGSFGEEERAARRGLVETRHSLWEVRKLSKETIRLRELFSGKDSEVVERRQPAGLKKGDLLEARLVPVDGRFYFSPAFCFHPVEAKKPIAKELKRLKKEQPGFSTRAFVWTVARMQLKWERYRNIAVTDIYAFGRKTV